MPKGRGKMLKSPYSYICYSFSSQKINRILATFSTSSYGCSPLWLQTRNPERKHCLLLLWLAARFAGGRRRREVGKKTRRRCRPACSGPFTRNVGLPASQQESETSLFEKLSMRILITSKKL